MAGKKSTGKHYVSKGERPTVTRKLRNALRADRKRHPEVDAVIKSQNVKSFIVYKNNPQNLATKFAKEDQILRDAIALHEQYGEVMENFFKERNGLKYVPGGAWAGCVQAVKTDYVPTFHLVWGNRAKDYKSKDPKQEKYTVVTQGNKKSNNNKKKLDKTAA